MRPFIAALILSVDNRHLPPKWTWISLISSPWKLRLCRAHRDRADLFRLSEARLPVEAERLSSASLRLREANCRSLHLLSQCLCWQRDFPQDVALLIRGTPLHDPVLQTRMMTRWSNRCQCEIMPPLTCQKGAIAISCPKLDSVPNLLGRPPLVSDAAITVPMATLSFGVDNRCG